MSFTVSLLLLYQVNNAEKALKPHIEEETPEHLKVMDHLGFMYQVQKEVNYTAPEESFELSTTAASCVNAVWIHQGFNDV